MQGYLIQSYLEWYARETPAHPALLFQGESLAYADLDRLANQLANALISNGIEQQQKVGIYIHKGLELGVAIYGILKAGCVFVPLDPFMPEERLQIIMDDCDIRHLITSDVLAAKLDTLQHQKSLCVYGPGVENRSGFGKEIGKENQTNFKRKVISWDQIRQQPVHRPNLDIINLDMAYIMYTSGSTGTPKGMIHTHQGSINYARWGKEHVGLTAKDRVASHAPLHFDLSIFDFFSTVQAGATVVPIAEPVTKMPASWTNTIDSEQISVVFTVPYTLITMLEQGAIDQRNLSSLRWIMFGGEPMPPRQLRQLMDRLKQVQFTNVYGPAEAPSCTCYDIPAEFSGQENESIPIGKVSRNSQMLIIDEHNQPCDIEQPGELCIRSATLTLGYHNRPDLNAKAFLELPGPGTFPDVYYRTGDRVVQQSNDLLMFLGRTDRMVKTRGNRVELDEIEAALTSHPDVFEAAAFTVPDDHGSNKIILAATVKPDADLSVSGAQAHLRKKIPSYAIPQQIEMVASLPHTSTGKLDRNALAANWLSS